MTKHTVHVDFPGRFVFIGFGSIGQGVSSYYANQPYQNYLASITPQGVY